MRWLMAVLALFAVSSGMGLGHPDPAAAEPPSCLQVTWQAIASDCAWTYAEYESTHGSDTEHTWAVTLQCANGGICADHVECVEGGAEGFVHDVYMDGIDVGDVCVPQAAISEPNITALIIRAFKNYGWPASELVVQPPGGKTLVNLETNFYTTDNQVITRSITVAGRSVMLRATPSYTFNFGDRSSITTSSPGRPHPDLDVTHTYAVTGDVVVSLDTTYTGEFRIGDGEWQPIADTLTVTGAGNDLQVVEALPQLVIR